MKYINLNRNINDESYRSAVLRTGCGPNYIRNRPQLFETMIKEQGLEFWFRFWLSFCLNHNVTEFNEFEEEVPGWEMTVYQVLHDNFVEVSSKEALRFCWNVILKSSSEFAQIAFACALGDIFYKWLNTDENEAGKKYWSVPDRYLEPGFKPGVLEKFLVEKWGIKLAKFFGVGVERLPWVRQMLRYDRGILKYAADPSIGKPTGPSMVLGLQFEDRIQIWKSKVKQMRHEIQTIDESRKVGGIDSRQFKRVKLRDSDRSYSSQSEILLQSDSAGDKMTERERMRKRKNAQFSSCTNTCCVHKGRRNKKEVKIRDNSKTVSSLP